MPSNQPYHQDQNFKHIPSFFKHSYVKTKHIFDENEEIANEHIYIDYDSPNHIRLMKRFKTPENYDTFGDSKEEEIIHHEINNTQKYFLLRYYLPKRIISNRNSSKDKPQGIQHIVIMFNGLKETERYDFYDLMGSQFATQGIAAVLLPTPFHLNRRINKRDDHNKRESNTVKDPMEVADKHAEMFYYNYKRSIHELEKLIKLIHGEKYPDEDSLFYETYFPEKKKTKISLLGYSLGGLRALGGLLLLKDDIHSCVTFNTSFDPFKVANEHLKISHDTWNKVETTVDAALIDKFKKSDYLNTFIVLYNRSKYNRNQDDNFFTLRDNFVKLLSQKDISRKFLTIQSGADRIVDRNPASTLTHPSHGINSLIIAGVDHTPTMDKEWDHWLALVGQNIIDFIRNCDSDHLTHQDIKEEITKLLEPTDYYKKEIPSKYLYRDELEAIDFKFSELQKIKSQLSNDVQRQKFEELYFLSKVYYPKFSELLAAISGLPKRKTLIVTLNKNALLYFGPGENKYAVSHQLHAGHEITILEFLDNGWLKVELEDQQYETNKELYKYMGYMKSIDVSLKPGE